MRMFIVTESLKGACNSRELNKVEAGRRAKRNGPHDGAQGFR